MVSLLRSLRHHSDEVSCCAFSPALLASGSGDKTLRLYDTSDFSEVPHSPLSGHGYGVRSCCFSACGGFLLSCSADGYIAVWRTDTGEAAAELLHPDRSALRVCAVAPDSSVLLAGASDGSVVLWDFPSRTLLSCRTVSEASVVSCCFSPCSQMFLTGCSQGDLRLWDVNGDLIHAEKDAHDLGVACCTFAPQYSSDEGCLDFRAASCGQDSRLKIWALSQSGAAACVMKLLHTLSDQSAPVLSCAFSSDGALVVSGSVDKTVTVYDVVEGILLHRLQQHDRYVTAVAMSPTMPWIATGSMDRTVNVWRIGDGSERPEDESKATLDEGRGRQTHTRLQLQDWSEKDVQAWMCEEGLEELLDVFKDNNMDGAELSELTRDTMTELGIESVGLRGRLLRKIQTLKDEMSSDDFPDEFLCPISRELMKDPVIAEDGYSYERDSIEVWIKGKNKRSPMTNLPLKTTLLTPNRSLKTAIQRWRSTH